MNIVNFENFIVLAKEKNIAKAARTLFMSPSALSKQLSSMENEMGITLFKRDTNPLELTHAGWMFLETAINVTAETKALNRKLCDLSDNVKGHIQLGVTSLRVEWDFAKILPEFLEKYPNCCIDLTASTTAALRDMLLSGEIDIAICSDYLSSDQLDYTCLAKEEMVLMVSKNHPLAVRAGFDEHGKRLCCKAKWFKDEKFLVQSKQSPTRHAYAQFFDNAGFVPQISIMNCSSPLLLKIASETNYCVIYSEYYLNYFPDLVGFSFENPAYQHFSIIKRSNYIYNHQEQNLVNMIKAFYSQME